MPPTSPAAATTILLVDDSALTRARIAKMLIAEGYQVIEVENGHKAVETYHKYHPDLVLLDVTMPVMDGLSALKRIRNIDAKARVIMLSALGQESVVLEAIKSGARDFVVKPFQKDRILKAINQLLK